MAKDPCLKILDDAYSTAASHLDTSFLSDADLAKKISMIALCASKRAGQVPRPAIARGSRPGQGLGALPCRILRNSAFCCSVRIASKSLRRASFSCSIYCSNASSFFLYSACTLYTCCFWLSVSPRLFQCIGRKPLELLFFARLGLARLGLARSRRAGLGGNRPDCQRYHHRKSHQSSLHRSLRRQRKETRLDCWRYVIGQQGAGQPRSG